MEVVCPNKTFKTRIKCNNNTMTTHMLHKSKLNSWQCKCRGVISWQQLTIRIRITIQETIKSNNLLIPACPRVRTVLIMVSNSTLNSSRITKVSSNTINLKLTVLKAAHLTDLRLTLTIMLRAPTLLSKMTHSKTKSTSQD